MADKISNVRRKELEQPDPFLESMHRAIETAKQLKKQLIAGAIVIFSIILIVSITIYTISSAENRASEMLTDALKGYASKKPDQSYDAVKGSFTKLIDEYPNTASGKIGRARFADICYESGDYETAYKHYIISLDDFEDNSIIKNMLLSSLGHTCQTLKRYQEAHKYFNGITKSDTDFMKDEALFNLSMVYMLNGDNQKGVEFLKEISSDYKNSMYKVMADNIIAQN